MNRSNFDFEIHSEQDLTESLITEAISIHSEKFFYIPRSLVSLDEILGEDRLSEFKDAYPIEAYFENVSQFDGQGAFLTRYGAFIDYSANLTIVRRHWDEAVGRFGKSILPNRPCEGDLIYYPKVDSLFVIKYVDDKNPFAQLGKFYTYKLNIELYQYSSEKIETENPNIDAFESLKTFDQFNNKTLWNGVVDVEIVDGGLGYKENPFIHVQSVTGFGAKFSVELSPEGSITKIKIIEGGEGYQQDDSVEVIGNCSRKAKILIKVRNQVELAGDKWGSNTDYKNHAKKDTEDLEIPFGEMSEEALQKELEKIPSQDEFTKSPFDTETDIEDSLSSNDAFRRMAEEI